VTVGGYGGGGCAYARAWQLMILGCDQNRHLASILAAFLSNFNLHPARTLLYATRRKISYAY